MLLFAGQAFSQRIVHSEDPFFRIKFNKEKKAIVEDFMQLSGEQAGNFWPVYNDYLTEVQQIGTARLKLLESYAEKFETLTEQQADRFMEEALRLRYAQNDLKEKYYKKMKKKTSALTASRWMQLEEHIYLTIQMQISDEIPFVGQ